LGISYLIANTIAYIIGILNGYILSSRFVFKKDKSLNNMMKFFIVYISALFINLGIMYICVDAYNMHKLIAPIFAIGIGTIYNYTLNKIWTFR
jgi:putative flippase GtrA